MPDTRALIIDDNPNNILVLEQLLRIEAVSALHLSVTANLAADLDTLQDIAVVFLDLEMPVLDGYAALAIVKQHPNFQNTRVVAYSVHVSELSRALALGFDGFLGKPLSAEAFPQQLADILRGNVVCFVP